jgi:hypothetical protein
VKGSEESDGQTADWGGAAECGCLADTDPVMRLLRLLTLLANCGLSAGAPPVLQTQPQN